MRPKHLFLIYMGNVVSRSLLNSRAGKNHRTLDSSKEASGSDKDQREMESAVLTNFPALRAMHLQVKGTNIALS